MARSENAPGKGHNKGPLSREEHKQLLTHHIAGLRQMLPQIDETKAELKALQEDFTAKVNQAKADLGKGYTRKYLMTLLEDSTTRLRDLLAEEDRRARDREALGLPVFGLQADLFGDENTPQEARDEIAWEAEGYLVGRRAGERKPPEGCPPRFDQAFLKGYDRGQEENGRLFIAAQELIARRGQPDTGDEDVDLNADADDEEADLDAKAEALANSGFMERSGDPDSFEASEEELAAQTTRQAVVDAKEGATSGEVDNAPAAA